MKRFIALMLTLLDDFLIIIAIFFLLPLFGLVIPFWLVLLIVLILAFLSVLLYKAFKHLENPSHLGIESVIGKRGEALSDLDPKGLVYLDNELWSAISTGDKIRKGEKVVVKRIEGSVLIVEKTES